jgi:hypothetical protein
VTLGLLAMLTLVGAPLLLGFLVVRALAPRLLSDPLAAGGLAYLVGALGLGALLLLWLALALPLESLYFLPALAVVLLVLWRLGGRPGSQTEARAPIGAFLGVALGLACLLSLARALRAAELPVVSGDEALIYAHKAKILFDVGALGEPLAARARQQDAHHFDYPALNPLLQLWSFILAGRILLIENRFPVQLAGLALFALLSAALRARLRPAAAGVLLLLLATSPVCARVSSTAGADLMTALGLASASVYGLSWLRTRAREELAATALSLTFLVACKNEGLPYALSVSTVLALASGARPSPREAAWMLLPALAALPTWSFNARHGFANDVINAGAAASLSEHAGARLAPVLAHFAGLLFAPETYQLLFALFFALLILRPAALRDREFAAATAIVLAVLGTHVTVYLLTPNDLEWHLRTAAARVLFHVLPTAVLALARAIALHPFLGPRLGARGAAQGVT